MAVLERSELQASPLADLHAIADQLGLDGFRRVRKPEPIDAILGEAKPEDDGEVPAAADPDDESGSGDSDRAPLARSRRRGGRSAT